jgi:hypothetical protein
MQNMSSITNGLLPEISGCDVMKVHRDDVCYYAMKWLAVCLVSTTMPTAIVAQMVSPAIDSPEEPFSYFSKPTDEIGVMDAPEATEITPEGYLYTGYGELMFFTGPEDTPVNQRIRGLERGYLPIIHYTWRQNGIAYRFSMFAATLDGTPEGTLVDFVRVTMRNESQQPARAIFAAGMRYQGPSNTGTEQGDNRFQRPAEAARPGEYRQPGIKFSSDWEYRFTGNAFVRDGKVMYVFEPDVQEKAFTLQQYYNNIPDLTPRRLHVQETTPVGIIRYRRMLVPGEESAWVLKMPVIPVEPGPELTELEKADFDAYKEKTVSFWDAIVDQGMNISVPEAKVNNTFRASLVYDLMARDKIGENYIQAVNKLHYHAFWLRDSSDIVRSYDVTGYPEIARQVLDFFPRWQTPEGLFLSQDQQYDAWGEVLYAYGQHFRMTHDRAFAENVFPSIERAIAWLKQARRTDPLHLIPAADVLDNEYVAGHLTGYNFLALGGLQNAILMAKVLGNTAAAEDFQQEYNDYRATFLKKLDEVTKATDGYIPPALDGQKGGQDWGNLLGTYPEHVLDPYDPHIIATLKATQAKYQEGIMTYGDGRWLHHYLTIKNTETEVARGDQEEAVRELYALLLHTSSTQAGFEFAIHPWGNRDFMGNLSPHGWFAAEYRTLLRNMLVREDGGDLHLLSVVSPSWIGVAKQITVADAPTEFGPVNYELQQPDSVTAILYIHSRWKAAPRQLVIHLPWFMSVSSATVDGKAMAVTGNMLLVPPGTQEVRLHWSHKSGMMELSYQHAVEIYKAEYRRRYERLLHGSEYRSNGADHTHPQSANP